MKLKEYYRLGNYDPGGGYGTVSSPSPHIGKQSSGRSSAKYIYKEEGEENLLYSDIEEDDEDEIDDYVLKIIAKKTGSHKSKTDRGRVDNATLVKNNHYGIHEYAGHHKNYAAMGLSPRLTYRSKTNTKGPALGVQSTAAYIRNRPGRKSGTQYGTSRKHKIMTDIEDDNIFNLQDLLNPMEISFRRHNNKTKKILSIIKEYLLFDKKKQVI